MEAEETARSGLPAFPIPGGVMKGATALAQEREMPPSLKAERLQVANPGEWMMAAELEMCPGMTAVMQSEAAK